MLVSTHSNSDFTHHIVIYWSLFKEYIESLHNNSHQKETMQIDIFRKIDKAMKVKSEQNLN